MRTFKNIKLIGTSHIAIQSVKEVESIISKERPEIVALELDKKRFYVLMAKNPQKNLRMSSIGLKGYLFAKLGSWIQQKIGKATGILPGTEMKTAINLAKRTGAYIYLIDQDIEITLKKLSKEITWKEKLTFLREILLSPFSKKIKIDLRKVPDTKLINTIIQKVKKQYPSIYKILIEERNEIMAKNLYKIMSTNQDKRIIAVIGAGHLDEITNLLNNYDKKS